MKIYRLKNRTIIPKLYNTIDKKFENLINKNYKFLKRSRYVVSMGDQYDIFIEPERRIIGRLLNEYIDNLNK